MSKVYENVNSVYESIKERIPFQPKVAIVLGSGLGEFVQMIDKKGEIPYKEIQGFPVSTVPGHEGRFVFGYVEKVPVVIMQGRVHYYEGYTMEQVVLPVRLMKVMGAEILFLTNASGGINEQFQPGDFMMITDQIGQFVPSPLAGENPDEFGVRFPDMSEIYSTELQSHIKNTAEELNISLRKGVYIQFTGPEYETPAEIRMAKVLGADAVGMSTACEAIAANHMGMKVCGISCICNLASGISEKSLSHQEVQKAADKAAPYFRQLVWKSVERMGKEFHK